MTNGAWVICLDESPTPFSDGEMHMEVREERSAETVSGSAKEIKKRFEDFTGIEKLEGGFSVGKLFSDVFKRHSTDEVEEMFAVGISRTVPSIESVDLSWPRPWMFFRALTGAVSVYAIFVLGWEVFENVNLIPGLIAAGAFAIPLATLLFFFEVNVRKNVSLYQVLRMVALGGVVSLVFSLVLFALSPEDLGFLGDSIAGCVEEPGKLVALLMIAKSGRYHYKLNGLLLGAAVGTGFAAFESMGYAFNILLQSGPSAMNTNILMRGFLSPFGHIAWTAICGAAMWRVKGKHPFNLKMVDDPKFWRLAIVSVGLHMVWNADFDLPFLGKYLLLGAIAWFVVLSLVQEGLNELRAERQDRLVPKVKVADCQN